MIRPLVLTLTLAWTLTPPARADEPVAEAVAPSADTPTLAPPPPITETIVRARPQPPAQPSADQAAAASVVLPDESPRAYDDLASLLAAVPGVNVVRTGSLGTLSTITLRGSNPDQVRIYIDGVPVNIVDGGGVDLSTLPIGDVERVEIYRGSSPLQFGQSALGGVISITTRTPGPARASARTGTGSFGTMFGDVSGGGRLGRLRLYLGLHGFMAQGDFPYLNDNMTALNPADDQVMPRQNNDVQQGDGVLRAGLTLTGRRALTLGIIGFAREQGLPGPGGAPTVSARFGSKRGLAYLGYESRDDVGPGGRLSAQMFASWQRDRLHDPAMESGLGGASMTHDTTTVVGANAHASRPFGDWARGALVLEGRRESYQPINDLAAVPVGLPASRYTGVAGGEIDLRWRWADLDVIPSARLEALQDTLSRRNTGGAPIEGLPAVYRRAPVLRAGLVRPLVDRQALKMTLKGNVGRYVRVPSFIELYGNGTGKVLGNADLVPEQGTNADVGIWLDGAGERAAIVSRTTAFAARVDDLIQWQYSSFGGQARADNVASARVLGVEQELRLSVGRHFGFVGQATVLDARDRSPNTAAYDNQLPLHPRYRGYLRPELTHLAMPAGLEIAAYADAEWRTHDFEDPANIVDMHARLLLGCGLTLAWPIGRLRATASALNLTGTQLQDVPTWALPGRAVFFAVAYAPIGAEAESGSAIFDPRYGQ
ncbi:MAG TPA: TonB-dependent receptor [Polyangia bacterium]|nr:TonB-dependent receptor [Polyangia bacterium]